MSSGDVWENKEGILHLFQLMVKSIEIEAIEELVDDTIVEIELLADKINEL